MHILITQVAQRLNAIIGKKSETQNVEATPVKTTRGVLLERVRAVFEQFDAKISTHESDILPCIASRGMKAYAS